MSAPRTTSHMHVHVPPCFLQGLIIDEASLTGESDPIKKDAEQDPWVRSGTSVNEGSGKVLIVAVGFNSEWGEFLFGWGRVARDGWCVTAWHSAGGREPRRVVVYVACISIDQPCPVHPLYHCLKRSFPRSAN